MTPLLITPKTKIYDLLEAYPQLEEVLITHAPEFKRLKNPLLRNTIARITTIAQAATIGGLAVEALVNELRAQIGQNNTTVSTGASCTGKINTEEAGSTLTFEQPAWFSPAHIQSTFDLSALLNRGEHPVHEVLSKLKKLEDDQILEIEAPFLPAPLIDKASSLGYAHWLKQETDGKYRIYFKRSL